ncbi:MAG: prepilin-type N-terminal cleavage/methylation domain-containing protein [Desulfuromonadales bacterium]|nr:prepilin-type N-terminal cleavage/methylation domain-containing protein [Desulfuromonadales bacterium]
MMKNSRGFTLIELVVAMAIMVVAIIIAADAFDKIMYKSSQTQKSSESDIAGIFGLEVLRTDLNNAGFGLPWSFEGTVNYAEAASNSSALPGIDPATFNDAPSNPPRAILSGDNGFNKDSTGVGSKYIVIKSVLAPTSALSNTWQTIYYSFTGDKTARPWGDTTRDIAQTTNVIVLRNVMTGTSQTRSLVTNSAFSPSFSTPFSNISSFISPNHSNGDVFTVYGVSASTTSAPTLIMPFNRTDYYIRRPANNNIPDYCAPNTGILYKSVLTHSAAGGTLTPEIPLLNCVADMQIVYGMDSSGNGLNSTNPNLYQTDINNTVGYPADVIRNQLKEVRVYILAQDGKRDPHYTYPSQTIEVGEKFGGTLMGRDFDLKAMIGDDYVHYRWKVYTITARPTNLLQN